MTDLSKHTGDNVPKAIKTLSFNVNSNAIADTKLINLANEFARLPEYEGISATPLIRNFFIRKFREAIDAAKAKELSAAS